MLKWILKRLHEPSTWRGVVTVVTGAGVVLSPEQMEAIVAAGLAVAGLINVFRNEGKQTQKALERER